MGSGRVPRRGLHANDLAVDGHRIFVEILQSRPEIVCFSNTSGWGLIIGSPKLGSDCWESTSTHHSSVAYEVKLAGPMAGVWNGSSGPRRAKCAMTPSRRQVGSSASALT